MPSDFDIAWSVSNLKRAWLWTTTNTEVRFKNYFRHIYRAYSLAPNKNLDHLRGRLIGESYQPTHATKIFFPKKSGVLRPYSLLAVEDQIVYQALANVVADRMLRRVMGRYLKSVFGHLYAGKRSRFFYRDWRDGYSAFSRAIEKAYHDGYKFTASFDLTACYDSIDHSVLKYYLRDLDLDQEFCEYLCRLLKHWSAASNDKPIYHGHGIPQGPLPSGLVAEVVLRHFDENRINSRAVRYFRYVDDIRLFAKSEKELRRRLVELDLLSKEIGLFPQTGKIDIHEVRSISREIKSISNPPEPVARKPAPDQERVRKRLRELTYRYEVENSTRFKYVLAAAAPNAELAKRLLKVLERQPHLYESVIRYLSRFEKLSRIVSRQCMDLLREYDFYSAFTAALVGVLRGRIHGTYKRSLNSYCRSRLTNATRDQDPELRAAAASVLLINNSITWARIKYNILWKKHWWVRSELIKYVQKDNIGDPSYEYLLNALIRDNVPDVALVGAEMLAVDGIKPNRPIRNIQMLAQHSMRSAGLIGRISAGVCPVSEFMKNVLGNSVATIDWKRFLGTMYSDMVPKTSRWRAYSDTDATAWVNITDTMNDVILDVLYRHDGVNIGTYTLGNIGSVLNNPRSRFGRRYPTFYKAVKDIHDARLESDLSHPIVKATRRPTRWIKYKEMEGFKKQLRDGYLEMWRTLRL